MREEKPLGKEINRIANLIRREVDKNVHPIDRDEASRCNGWIIEYIIEHSDCDIFQKDIEKELSITRSTVSKVVDLMVKKGMIVRSPVDYDARLKKLTLTPKAHQIHQQVHKKSDEFEERLTQGFSNQEIQQLREYLSRLENNLIETANE